ncbi:50S ribosomal protein L17 [Patescibacteria group bacterium]
MRHHNTNRKFGREKDQRNALMQSLARALVVDGKIKTTEAKAKELRPMIEKLITRAKNGTLHSRRILVSRLDADSAEKLVTDIAPKYKDRAGGYTRITKISSHRDDAAKMAVIELV